MKTKVRTRFILPLVLLIGLGAGCTSTQVAQAPVPTPAPVPAPAPVVDPYDGWGTLQPGGVVSLRIPPGCHGDPGAGNIYVVCPTPGNDTPTPDMHISSDGIQVNIKRWEDQSWDQWDKVIASLKVIQPQQRDIQINIQK